MTNYATMAVGESKPKEGWRSGRWPCVMIGAGCGAVVVAGTGLGFSLLVPPAMKTYGFLTAFGHTYAPLSAWGVPAMLQWGSVSLLSTKSFLVGIGVGAGVGEVSRRVLASPASVTESGLKEGGSVRSRL